MSWGGLAMILLFVSWLCQSATTPKEPTRRK